MKWKSLQMPKEIVTDQSNPDEGYARFVMEPLERGFGATIGHSLRRVLLASIQGAAPVALRINGVLHEFGAIDGVYEDITDIVLNVKKMQVRLNADERRTLTLKIGNKGKVTAGSFDETADVDIINPDLHLLELTADKEISIEVDIDYGRGYVISDLNKREDSPVGTIFLDSFFSPVIRVNYEIENTRVGQKTDYDRLLIDVWTDGTMTPEDALGYAAKIVKDHMQLFIHIDEELEIAEEEEEDEEVVRIRQLLKTRVDELELSVRSSNCLRAANIQNLGELVSKTESEMLKYRNFGRKSLNELTAILEELNLSFGMDIEPFQEKK
ncbi:MAG: DNA-directed RNA polymerase subunit alpha [candidate division Zixibacteria bacterium]|nr:DNA-directed RNA polymerase subunit alpha [candidate division Zixibacteria bacterium]